MQDLLTIILNVAPRCATAATLVAACVAMMLLTATAAEAKSRAVDLRPTKAALIACQMGPHFIGAAYRGKRYRPYTRTGRPRICVTEVRPAQFIL
jgi:hypothetical protein